MNAEVGSKIALVTGGTSGVGLSLVKELVRSDFFVHFIGTNREKGEAIESELGGVDGSKAKFIPLDLSNLKAVKDFADQFKSEVPRLDLLVNVAGVMLRDRQETAEGLEMTFAGDHLSAFLLSQELVEVLAKANQSRIVNVSGGESYVLKPRLDFENMDYQRNYSAMGVAVDAVHAKTVMTEILAEKLKDQNISVNAFDPGAVKSGIHHNLPLYARIFFAIIRPFMSNTTKAGIYASTAVEMTGVTGQFVVKTSPKTLSFDKAYKDQLWNWTSQAVEKALGAAAA